MDRVAQTLTSAGCIEQDARVVAVADGVAWVEARRASACGHCTAASGCSTAVVAKLFGETPNRIQVTDAIGVAIGDQVVIGIADSALTRASLLAYLVPLIALILAAFAAQQAGAGEGLTALSGLIGLAFGLWATARLAKRKDAEAIYRPTLLRRHPPLGVPFAGSMP